MTKKKKIGGVAFGIALLVITGAVLLSQQEPKQVANTGQQVAGAETNTFIPDSAGAVSQSIPLTGAGAIPADANSLKVGSNTGMASASQAAGQNNNLSVGQSQQQGQPAQDQPNPFDPTQFGQYDQYKNADSALFREVVPGEGEGLGPNQKATVYYRGWLTNGTKFDESRTNSAGQLEPFQFTLGAGSVIEGWEQALSGMKVGAVRLVIVPPNFGYKSTPQGSIPANSVLIFQVQLAKIN